MKDGRLWLVLRSEALLRRVAMVAAACVVAGCVGGAPKAAPAPAPGAAAGWETMTLAGGGCVGVCRNGLAVDDCGSVHVAYCAGTSLHHGQLSGGKWQSECVEAGSPLGFCHRAGQAADLALDKDRLPVVSYGYSGCLTGDGVALARKTRDGKWHHAAVSKTGNLGRYTAVTLDPQDRVHVTWLDYKKQDDLYYAVSTGDGWEVTAVDVEPNAGFFCDLAVDASGTPHVVYATVEPGYEGIDYTSDDYVPDDLKYATLENGRWVLDTIDTCGNVGYWPSVRLDGEGKVHVSWAGEHRIQYAVHTTGAWTVRVVDEGDDVGTFTALALDADGMPWIAYNRGRRLWVAHWTGSDWTRERVDGSGSVGENCAIDIDPRGTVHVAYADRAKKDLKYARLKR